MAPIKAAGSRKLKRHPGVKKLKDGRWLLLTTWTDKRTGQKKFRRKIFEGTRDEAVAARAVLRAPGRSAGEPSRQKFRGFAEAWLERRRKKGDLESSTEHRYVADVSNLNVEFGEWFVDAIDYDELERWQTEMHRKIQVPKSGPPQFEHQYAAATINSWHRTVRLILDAAVRKNMLTSNPAREISTLPEGRTRGARGTALAAVQLKSFMDAIPLCVAKEPRPSSQVRRPRRKKGEEQTIAPDVARCLYVYA